VLSLRSFCWTPCEIAMLRRASLSSPCFCCSTSHRHASVAPPVNVIFLPASRAHSTAPCPCLTQPCSTLPNCPAFNTGCLGICLLRFSFCRHFFYACHHHHRRYDAPDSDVITIEINEACVLGTEKPIYTHASKQQPAVEALASDSDADDAKDDNLASSVAQ
jgi:hypothetical protein